jgi:Fe-S-cluster-containing dehydrogenase component
MANSAEQIHLGQLNIEPAKGQDIRLFVDLDICASGECEDCDIKCSYLYHPEEQQKEKNNLLIRHNMRCVSCKSCSHACPYGTIYPEHVPFLIHICDFCLDRMEQKGEPLCIQTCKHGALELKMAGDVLGENTFLVGDNLIVHSTHWTREKA